MKTALVIGGTGLLGRGVADELQAAGWAVSILSRGQKELPAHLSSCELISADRGQPGALDEAIGERPFDLVVDCAAYNRKDAEGAVKVFNGKVSHYWFISTDFVYAADPAARFPTTENATTQTDMPYAANKLEAEAYLLHAAQNEAFPVTILRPPHILGAGRPAGCDPAADGRDTQLLARIRKGEEIPLLGRGSFLIQPVWSRDIGECVHQLYRQPDTIGQVFNIAGKECVTVLHYYQMVADLEQLTLRIKTVCPESYGQEFPSKAHVLRHRIYNTEKLQQAGFSPKTSLLDALKETLAPVES